MTGGGERGFKYEGLGNDFVVLDRRASGIDVSPSASRAVARNTSPLICTSTSGRSRRFRYQAGCSGDPPLEATITGLPSTSR